MLNEMTDVWRMTYANLSISAYFKSGDLLASSQLDTERGWGSRVMERSDLPKACLLGWFTENWR